METTALKNLLGQARSTPDTPQCPFNSNLKIQALGQTSNIDLSTHDTIVRAKSNSQNSRQPCLIRDLSMKNKQRLFSILKIPHLKKALASEDNPSQGNVQSSKGESPSRAFRKYKNKISAKRSRLNKTLKYRQAEVENVNLKNELIKLNSIYNSEFLRQLNIIGFKDKQICQQTNEGKKETQNLIDVKNIDLLFCRLVKILMPIEVQLLSRNYCNSNKVLSLDDLKSTLVMHRHMFESMNKNTHLSTNVRVYQILEMFEYLFSIISSAQRVLEISQS